MFAESSGSTRRIGTAASGAGVLLFSAALTTPVTVNVATTALGFAIGALDLALT